jgi:hypothetical protein
LLPLPAGRGPGGGFLAALAVLLSLSAARAQPPEVRAAVEGAPKQVALSGSARLTLVVEGPTPLRVELPKQLLTADANAIWGIRPDRDEAKVVPLGGGRERWSRTYRLTPFPPVEGPAAGKRAVGFSPVTVNGQPVTLPTVEIEVTSAVGSAAVPPHGIVGVEDPPPPPVDTQPSSLPWFAAVVGAAVLVLVAVAALRKPRAKPVPPYEEAVATLTSLLAAGSPGAAEVEQVAAVLRTYVERTFGIPATRLTTAELLAAARQGGRAGEQADALGLLLDACDRAKFAGDVPDADGCRRLVRAALDWLDDLRRAAGPR